MKAFCIPCGEKRHQDCEWDNDPDRDSYDQCHCSQKGHADELNILNVMSIPNVEEYALIVLVDHQGECVVKSELPYSVQAAILQKLADSAKEGPN